MRCENCGAVRDNSSGSNRSVNSSLSTTTISSIELQSLLRSPNPPPTSQIPGILASLDSGVSQYDARLRQLRSEIAALENERSWVKAQQEKYKSLLAPVRRLPTELLDHIFRIYGDTNQNHIGGFFLKKTAVFLPGLVLMGVCARWRDVAESCTALGRNISLNLNWLEWDEERDESFVMPLQWCLDHAGPTGPLDIAFTGTVPEGDGTSEPKVVGMLASHASRWRHASFTTAGELRALPSLDAERLQDLPMLDSLRSYKHGDCSDGELILFRKAPRLKELSCNCGLPDEWKELYSDFPWTQIRTLELTYSAKPDHQLYLPGECSNVQSLSYIFPISSMSLNPQVPPQRLENVSSLEISIEEAYAHPDILAALLDAAHFPGLERMKLRFRMICNVEAIEKHALEFTWPETEFTSFLLRSRCSLTSLHLENAVVSDNDLISLLLLTPELQAFSFHQYPRPASEAAAKKKPKAQRKALLTKAFIRRLHAFGACGSAYTFGNALIPKLKTLSLRVLGDWFNDDQLFVDVVRSRWIPQQALATKVGVQCLKSVDLKLVGREPDQRMYEVLTELGMRVEVSGDE